MARMKRIERLRLIDMVKEPIVYDGLRSGLNELPLPDKLKIKRKILTIPKTISDFGDNITYGQRLYFARPEGNDYGIILRFVAGFYYPIYTGKVWNENSALRFGAKVLNSRAMDLFPVARHFVDLMGEIAERELNLLQREPTRQEHAAGIEKLAKFADLNALIFLCESFKCDESAVMTKPYNDCLVRFMLQKESNAFTERLSEVYRNEQKQK